ncbi:MAG: hypothetical protein SNG35_06510 [Rikenellaceae bacterium]
MENNQQQTTVVVKSGKSVGLALVLTFFFGPLGMFYSTIAGAIVMFILTPIISIVTVGFALPVMWIIQLIWAGVAASNSNKGTSVQISSNTPQSPVTAPAEVEQPRQITKDNLSHYDDANRFSDSKIEEMLANGGSDLNADFVEALKFVRTERMLLSEMANDRKLIYNSAIVLSNEERNERLATPNIYSAISISALKYIQRCLDCDIKPSESGFLMTFEKGYQAPETPAERAEREQEEREAAKRKALKEKQEAEEAITAARNRLLTIAIFIGLIVVGVAIGVYANLIAPNIEYNKQIAEIDARLEYRDKTVDLEPQKVELNNIKDLYKEIDIPTLGSVEKVEYIAKKIAIIT